MTPQEKEQLREILYQILHAIENGAWDSHTIGYIKKQIEEL